MSYKKPESVLVLICTEDNLVLLMERTDIPGFWQSVTGSLEGEEVPFQTAARELKEETGLMGAPVDVERQVRYEIKPAWRKRFAPGVSHNLEHWFCFRLPAQVPVQLNKDEHRAAVWLPIEKAIEKCSSLTNRAAIKEFAPS